MRFVPDSLFNPLLVAVLGAALIGLALPHVARAEEPTVRFQDYPGSGNLLIRVARSKGYCKAAGIDCELKMIPAAPLGLQALIGGSIDVAETPMEVVAAAVQRGAKVKTISGAAVSAIFQIDVATKVPLPNQSKGYPAQMQDLKGLKVGVTARGAATESFFSFLMEQAGLKADDVTYVAVGAPNTAFAALRAGQVDAIVSWEPSGTMCNLTKECKVLFMGATATKPALLRDMYGAGTGLVMRSEQIDKHPEIAQAVVRVSKQAEAFVNDPANRAEVMKISDEYFKFDMPHGDAIAKQTLDLAMQANTFKTMVRRSAVQATLEYLKLTKQMTTLPTVNDLVWDQAPTE